MPMMLEIFREEGLPEELVYLAFIESVLIQLLEVGHQQLECGSLYQLQPEFMELK